MGNLLEAVETVAVSQCVSQELITSYSQFIDQKWARKQFFNFQRCLEAMLLLFALLFIHFPKGTLAKFKSISKLKIDFLFKK